MTWLLDTCVISELVARRPAASVVEWVANSEETRLYLSALTIGEIKRGIERLHASEQRHTLARWLEQDLLDRFQGRILSLDVEVTLAWGRLVAELDQKGRTLPAMDSLIAAVALRHDLKLVTRNEKDFDATGVTIVNPWR